MNLKGICLALVLFPGLVQPSFAMRKKKKMTLELITAYSRNIPESEQSNPRMQGTFVVARWNATTYPETVFWRGEGGWFTCNIEKAHKAGGVAGGYSSVSIMPDQIHPGDTLRLIPLVGGRFPIPAEIPENAKNTVFYKVSGNPIWLSMPVNKIEAK